MTERGTLDVLQYDVSAATCPHFEGVWTSGRDKEGESVFCLRNLVKSVVKMHNMGVGMRQPRYLFVVSEYW